MRGEGFIWCQGVFWENGNHDNHSTYLRIYLAYICKHESQKSCWYKAKISWTRRHWEDNNSEATPRSSIDTSPAPLMEHAIRKANIILLHMSVNAKHTLALSYPVVNDVKISHSTQQRNRGFELLSLPFTIPDTTTIPRVLDVYWLRLTGQTKQIGIWNCWNKSDNNISSSLVSNTDIILINSSCYFI